MTTINVQYLPVLKKSFVFAYTKILEFYFRFLHPISINVRPLLILHEVNVQVSAFGTRFFSIETEDNDFNYAVYKHRARLLHSL